MTSSTLDCSLLNPRLQLIQLVIFKLLNKDIIIYMNTNCSTFCLSKYSMAVSFLRRRIGVPLFTTKNFEILPWFCNFCSESSTIPDNNKESNPSTINPGNHSIASHLSPFLQYSHSHKDDFNVELVDPDLWRVSSSLAQSWRGTTTDGTSETECSIAERIDEMENYSTPIENEAEADFDDDIQDMRIRGKLFYKIDRDSREYEEYNFDFHRKKSSKKNKEKKEPKESKKKEKSKLDSSSRDENLTKLAKKNLGSELSPPLEEMNNSYEVKKLRKPSYNQLTGPYHEPFCLDLYISKSSVRACIVHRVTSKVVAVAHSISKDMKFDLSSTKDSTACVAVGAALAQRALADDIHDVIYTPRKGEKLDGKRLIVLQSVIDNGINVKVKFKQRNMSKKLPTLPFK